MIPKDYTTNNDGNVSWTLSADKKQPIEGLDEAAEKYANEDCVVYASRKKAFIAGAEWQKAKMMKGAVEGRVSSQFNGEPLVCARIPHNNRWGIKMCDKVKVIIVKED